MESERKVKWALAFFIGAAACVGLGWWPLAVILTVIFGALAAGT